MKAASGDNLMTKNGAYYFRRRVPLDLVDEVGKSDLTAPLGTKSRRRAKRLAAAYQVRLETAFDQLRSGEVDELEDRRAWVRAYAKEALDRIQRDIDADLEQNLRNDRGDELFEVFSVYSLEFAEGVDNDEDDALRAVIQGLADTDPDLLPRETWRPLAIACLRGLDSDVRFTEKPAPPPTPPVLRPAAAVVVSPAANGDEVLAAIDEMKEQLAAHGKAKNAKTIGDALELWAELRAGNEAIKASTVAEVKKASEWRIVQGFVGEFGADRGMDEVTSIDITNWLGSRLDSRVKVNAPPISSGTRKKYITQLAAFYASGIAEGWCLEHPAKAVAAKTGTAKARMKAGEQDRTAFPVDALPLIFSAELKAKYGAFDSQYAERFWLPALYLTGGFRAEEAAQAKVADFETIGGIHCFHVRVSDPETQSLKNVNSQRTVPLHPVLERLGFQQYIEHRRAAALAEGVALESAQLFAGLKPSKTHGWRNAACQFWNGKAGQLNRLGLYTKNIQVLHSLRHNAIAAMVEAGIPNAFRLALSGHGTPANDEGLSTYATQRSVQGMFEHLSQIDWDAAFKHAL